MKVKQIRENTTEEILAQIKEAEREITVTKVKNAAADGSVKPVKVRTLRRDVARMKTVIRERGE